MIINGVKLDIDFTDADIVDRIETGRQEVLEKANELENNKNLTPAEGIRQECRIIKDFLDYVFGEGTSDKLFGNKNSLKQCLQAFEDIAKARDEEINEFQARISKYSPDRLKK